MIKTIATRLSGRTIHVVADAAYHGKQIKDLPGQVTWTTRLPRNAALYERARTRPAHEDDPG